MPYHNVYFSREYLILYQYFENNFETNIWRQYIKSVRKKMMLIEDDPPANQAEFYDHIW